MISKDQLKLFLLLHHVSPVANMCLVGLSFCVYHVFLAGWSSKFVGWRSPIWEEWPSENIWSEHFAGRRHISSSDTGNLECWQSFHKLNTIPGCSNWQPRVWRRIKAMIPAAGCSDWSRAAKSESVPIKQTMINEYHQLIFQIISSNMFV